MSECVPDEGQHGFMRSELLLSNGKFSSYCDLHEIIFFFLLFIFRGRLREGERGKETLIGCLFLVRALTGDQTSDLLLIRIMPNQLSHTRQGCMKNI